MMESLQFYVFVIMLASKFVNCRQSENEFDCQIYFQIFSALQLKMRLLLSYLLTDLIRFSFSQHIHILKMLPQTSHQFINKVGINK